MSSRKLTILGVAAVAMLVWAVVQSRLASRSGRGGEVRGHLIQGFDPEDVASVVIGSGEDALKLDRRSNRFVVVNKDGYPADSKQINELITQVLDIETVELITTNSENYADLGVTEDGASKVVKFLDKQDRPITGVVIGKRSDSGGSYVRMVSAEQVYLSKETPWIRDSAKDYIKRDLLDVEKNKILSVTVSDPNGSYVLRSEPNSSIVRLEQEIPEGRQLKDNDYERVFSALTALRFNDVMKESKAAEGVVFDRSYVCRLTDETVYTLEIGTEDDKAFVKCRAEYTGPEDITKERRVESEEELKEKEARLLARDAAKEFNERHGGWVYEISSWKAENLTKSFADLLEDKPAPEPEDEEAALDEGQVQDGEGGDETVGQEAEGGEG